jgi:hypothetical protein
MNSPYVADMPAFERLVQKGLDMAAFPALFSIDQNDHLVVNIDPQYIPNGSAELDVDNALAGASQQFLGFTGTADLGAAAPGVFAMLLTMVGGSSSSATISISGLPQAMSLITAIPTTVTPEASGFDTATPLTAALISMLTSTYNYVFCLRYVARVTTTIYPADITSAEVGLLLASDVALMLVQHPMKAGWSPNAALGTTHGSAAATNAFTANVAKGVTIFCDLEGVVTGAAASDVADYCNNWSAAVGAAGYLPGLYVGADCGLTADQLTNLDFTLFWESCSIVPAPAQGFCMTQNPCDVNLGNAPTTIKVDVDSISVSPGTLTWLKKQSPLALQESRLLRSRKRTSSKQRKVRSRR